MISVESRMARNQRSEKPSAKGMEMKPLLVKDTSITTTSGAMMKPMNRAW